jgi:hypothetical protein
VGKRVTISQIAENVGVLVMTDPSVLNGKPGASADRRCQLQTGANDAGSADMDRAGLDAQ